jgi:AcrR family transcriptional regulator
MERRRQLLEVAREVFAAEGFGSGSLATIAGRTGIPVDVATSLFHSDVELFAAVCEQEHLRTSLLVTEAFARRPDPWEGTVDALATFLDRACDPQVRRITVLDAPVVLGWQRAHELGEDYCLFVVEEGLRRLVEAQLLEGHDVPMLAHLLHGALARAAARVARAEDPAAARAETEHELRGLFLGLGRS